MERASERGWGSVDTDPMGVHTPHPTSPFHSERWWVIRWKVDLSQSLASPWSHLSSPPRHFWPECREQGTNWGGPRASSSWGHWLDPGDTARWRPWPLSPRKLWVTYSVSIPSSTIPRGVSQAWWQLILYSILSLVASPIWDTAPRRSTQRLELMISSWWTAPFLGSSLPIFPNKKYLYYEKNFLFWNNCKYLGSCKHSILRSSISFIQFLLIVTSYIDREQHQKAESNIRTTWVCNAELFYHMYKFT